MEKIKREDFVRLALTLGFQPNPMLDVQKHIPEVIEYEPITPLKEKD